MPLEQNPHHTVTVFGFVDISMHACGLQIQQFCLFTSPPRSNWASSEKIMFFFDKIGIFCKSIAGPLPSSVQAYTQPSSFGGRIKLIICHIRHELCLTIHEISTSWKKMLDGGPYIKNFMGAWVKKRFIANIRHVHRNTCKNKIAAKPQEANLMLFARKYENIHE